MDKGKMKIIRVTTTTDYFVKFYKDGTTEINGWNLAGIIIDWFNRGRINRSHSTRDTCAVGGGKTYIKAEIIEEEEK